MDVLGKLLSLSSYLLSVSLVYNGVGMVLSRFRKVLVNLFGRDVYPYLISPWNWNEGTQVKSLNPYITTNQLRPSQYALAYIPLTGLKVYINVGFIALDAENLYEDRTDYYDFGDNKFPYFKGNNNKQLDTGDGYESDESDNEDVNLEKMIDTTDLDKYIPRNVLRFLNKNSI